MIRCKDETTALELARDKGQEYGCILELSPSGSVPALVWYVGPRSELRSIGIASCDVHYPAMQPGQMRRWKARFHGCRKGAIGATYRCMVEVSATDAAGARLALYETHDHVSQLELELLPENEVL